MTAPAADAIPLLDLAPQHGPLTEALNAACARVLESNRFIMGPEVAALESELADHLDVAYALGVSSGTDALLASLMALDIGPGDDVITTPFSFFATAGCITRVGARPVFIDIDPATYNLDVSRVEGAITSKTRAVVVVHLFGQAADLPRLRTLCDERGLVLVEDAAQAIDAAHGEHRVGTLGELGCFSFFPSKNLGAFGDAGLVTTSDEALAERVRALRTHGAQRKYHHELVGGNFRLDAIQAALLRVKLPHLRAWTAARQQNAARYDALFAASGLPAEVLSTPAGGAPGHVYNQYVLRVARRDALRAHLAEAQIETGVYYPLPLHLQPCFAELGYRPGSFPEAERASSEVLALPSYPGLSRAQLERVADTIVGYLN